MTANPDLAPVATQVVAQLSPPAAVGRGGRRGLVSALILILVVVAAGGGGAAFANASWSTNYSPGQAALDYFAAQQRADAAGMMANATFLHADPASAFFDRSAVTAMLRTRDNSDLKDVRVLSVHAVDVNTSRVNVSMTWAGTSRTATYTVRRDKSQSHYVFYNSWRVDIPSTTINLSLPNQPGLVRVDGIIVPSMSVHAISGYHTVTVAGTSFYDSSSKVADGVDSDAIVQLDGNLSPTAMSAAGAAINDTLNNHCDAAKYPECPGHTYTAANDGYIYYLNLPGYSEIDFKTYVFTLVSDPTAGMKVVVGTEAGQATASGTCATTLTVDGSQNYGFTGTWTAAMTWRASSFSQTDVKFDCAAAKA
jgi:hypothetical protein